MGPGGGRSPWPSTSCPRSPKTSNRRWSIVRRREAPTSTPSARWPQPRAAPVSCADQLTARRGAETPAVAPSSSPAPSAGRVSRRRWRDLWGAPPSRRRSLVREVRRPFRQPVRCAFAAAARASRRARAAPGVEVVEQEREIVVGLPVRERHRPQVVQQKQHNALLATSAGRTRVRF